MMNRPYGRMVPECHKRGIGRSKAYELESSGMIETFSIGRGKYVYLDSLDSLPERSLLLKKQLHQSISESWRESNRNLASIAEEGESLLSDPDSGFHEFTPSRRA